MSAQGSRLTLERRVLSMFHDVRRAGGRRAIGYKALRSEEGVNKWRGRRPLRGFGFLVLTSRAKTDPSAEVAAEWREDD